MLPSCRLGCASPITATRSGKDGVSATCKKSLYVESESRPNADTADPQVREFRDTMSKVYNGEFDSKLHQWALEGWAAAKLFTDAVQALGANVTRKGVIDWLNSQDDYTGGALLSPIDWRPVDFGKIKSARECVVMAKWDDSVANFVAAAPVPYCEDNAPYVSYTPA